MKSRAALVFEDKSPITIGGLTLTERAVLLAARAGLTPVRVRTTASDDSSVDALLRSRRISPVDQPEASSPILGIGDG